jgi:very-short-patch-repair endonuclease
MGGQHYDDLGKEKDEMRDDYLKKLGMRILRIPDTEVFKNLDGVIEKIYEMV